MSLHTDWFASLASDWGLFAGHLDSGNGIEDSVSFANDAVSQPNCFEDVCTQSVEDDDLLSICSTSTSLSGSAGYSSLETYAEAYQEFGAKAYSGNADADPLLPDEILAEITSCFGDSLPISFEQFHEISSHIGADEDMDLSVSSSHNAFTNDLLDSDTARGLSPFNIMGDGISLSITTSDNLPLTPHSADSNDSADSLCNGTEVKVECEEEIYEESVCSSDFCSSTISLKDLTDTYADECKSEPADFESSEDVKTSSSAVYRHPVVRLHGERRVRKKEQNKTAALRYRLKKRSEQDLVLSEYTLLERRNLELRTRLDSMTKEIAYLKGLINELCA